MYHATVRRVALVILVLIGITQAADAQSCAPPVIEAPAEICPAAYGVASVPPPAGGAWESVWWTISNGNFVQNGYPSSSAQGLSVTFQPGYTNAPVTLTAFGRDTAGCVTSTSSVQVPLREIDPIVISAPQTSCGGRFMASVMPPAEGEWNSIWWTISGGGHFDNGHGYSETAQGETVTVVVTNIDAIQLDAFAMDTFNCTSPHGTAQVTFEELDPVVIDAPATSCGGQATASVQPPAEGEWNGIWWTISSNGYFVSEYGYPSQQAQGETVTFVATTTAPLTLSVLTMNESGCQSSGTEQVAFQEMAPVVIDAPAETCPHTPASASVQPPPDGSGSWNGVWWTITNGYFTDPYYGQSTSAQGQNVTFAADSTQPVTLSAFALSNAGCQASQGTAQVSVREIDAVVLTAPAQVCPYMPASASVELPAEGTWESVWWSITNGKFVDQFGNQSTSAQGSEVMFIADTTSPVTLSAFARDSYGCTSPQGSRNVSIREIDAVVLTAPAQVCPYMPASASVEPPAEGTWESVWWSITNGKFVDQFGVESTSAQGSEVMFIAYTTSPVTLSAFARDSYGCTSPQGTRNVSIREIGAVVVTAPAQVCPYMPAGASVEPPAEGAWESVWWSITNGKFVDQFGVESTSAQGSEVMFIANTTSPVTLSAFARDSYGCTSPQGTRQVSIREINPVVIHAPASLCSLDPVAVTVEPPAEGTWNTLWWSITNGFFVDGTGNTSTSTTGSDPMFVPDGAGNVTLSVSGRDSFGCSSPAASVTIPYSEGPAFSIDVRAQGSEEPSTPGSGSSYDFCGVPVVELTATGNDPSWTYAWSTGATESHIEVTEGGTYTLTVTNASGCTSSQSVTVVMNPLPVASISGNLTFCPGGSTTLTAAGGDSYSWSNGATTPSIVVGSAGTYSVTVANANGCSATSAATEVVVNAAPATPVVTAGGPTTFCEGGSVTLTAPASASYLWSNGATTQSIAVSAAGSYSVTVTNASGCSATSAATNVVVKALPATTITASGPTSFCDGGSVTLTAPASASYLWSTGATTHSIVVSASGSFSVTVTSANGCTAVSAPVTVTENVPVKPTITASTTNVCPGGSVTLGSSAAVSYLWSTGATTQSITFTPSGSASYWVETIDANGCTKRSDFITVHVDAQMKPTVSIFGNPAPYCNGETVTLSAPQYIPARTYLWSTGETTRNIQAHAPGTYTVTVTNPTGCSNTSDPVVLNAEVPTATASGTDAICPGGPATIQADLTGTAPWSITWSDGVTQSGLTASPATRVVSPSATTTYTIIAFSDAICTGTRAGFASVTVNPAPAATITAGGPTTFCEGGSVTLTASESASYLWSTGATSQSIAVSVSGAYTVTTTNASGCSATSAAMSVTVNANPATPVVTASGPVTFCEGGSVTLTAPASTSYLWSNGATTQAIAVSASGSYSVTVTNASGCSATSSATSVTVNANPATPVVTASGPTTFCEGESVTLTAPASASYLWSNGATTQSIVVTASGPYSVTVANASGCSATSSATNVTVNTLPAATIAASGPATFCEGGSVTLTASESASYLWSTGAATQSIVVSASGSYSVTVTNASGCSATSAATSVTVNANPAQPAISASGPTTFCEGGSVTLTAPASASYLWSTGATTQSIAVNASGSYSVTVTNANGCSATSAATSVTVNANPAQPAISASGPTAFCEGGSVTLTAPASASYLWSTGATTQSIAVNASGSYSVTVTNASGCSATSAAMSVTVNANPAQPAITPSGPTTFCEGGSVTLTASASASYLWSNGATSQSIVVSASGSYSVTVTNASGCTATSAATAVTVNTLPTAAITPSGPTTFCEGGSVTLTASASASYLWSTGATTQSIVVSASGSYSGDDYEREWLQRD